MGLILSTLDDAPLASVTRDFVVPTTPVIEPIVGETREFSGTPGALAQGPDAFSKTGRSIIVGAENGMTPLVGNTCAKCIIFQGEYRPVTGNLINWGGQIDADLNVRSEQEFWMQYHTWYPSFFDFSTDYDGTGPAGGVKHLRMDMIHSSAGLSGHYDYLVASSDGSSVTPGIETQEWDKDIYPWPFAFKNLTPGVLFRAWNKWEIYVKVDGNTSGTYPSGRPIGKGIIRHYLNGKLMLETRDVRTITVVHRIKST
jgi:hypothetical protein